MLKIIEKIRVGSKTIGKGETDPDPKKIHSTACQKSIFNAK
jgi:hypothetical protein